LIEFQLLDDSSTSQTIKAVYYRNNLETKYLWRFQQSERTTHPRAFWFSLHRETISTPFHPAPVDGLGSSTLFRIQQEATRTQGRIDFRSVTAAAAPVGRGPVLLRSHQALSRPPAPARIWGWTCPRAAWNKAATPPSGGSEFGNVTETEPASKTDSAPNGLGPSGRLRAWAVRLWTTATCRPPQLNGRPTSQLPPRERQDPVPRGG
jgi:hypothetical protein